MNSTIFSAILEPFVLILLGYFLSRLARFPRSVWDGVEKLIYYVLFPPLLFLSVAQAQWGELAAGRFVGIGVLAMGFAVLSAYVLSRVMAVDRVSDASLRQCGYRFNSYIGLALANGLYGPEGGALFALLMGVWVPISNGLATYDLLQAKHQKGDLAVVLRSIVTNPLIVATLLGLVARGMDVALPLLLESVLRRLSSSSLALALLSIGAGMMFDVFQRHSRVLLGASIQRLLVVPLVAIVLGHWVGLGGTELGVLLAFTALPTANSCYILTVRLNGNGPLVADLTSLQSAFALVTLPLWFMGIHLLGLN